MSRTEEDEVWESIDPDDLWILDKLILSRKLGYNCGPTGLDVSIPGWYIVRPCVNMIGLGMGAQKVWLEKETNHLPLGFFWCEFFSGKHLSIDYHYGVQTLCVEGIKTEDTFTRWKEWKKVNEKSNSPNFLKTFFERYEWVNCEYIGGKLIEVHLRRNQDFDFAKTSFIPVWEGQDTNPPEGYRYIEYPDLHGRIGAFIR